MVAGLERMFYISPFELRDFVETARREIDLTNGAHVIGKVGDAADDAVELGRVDLARLLQGLEPPVRFASELVR